MSPLLKSVEQSSLVNWVAAGMISVVMGGAAGAIAGFSWGGVFGRIAMRILVFTSDDRVRGVTSDDGFIIGQITFETIGLLVITTLTGALLGAMYGAARMLTVGSPKQIAIGMGIAFACFGGGAVVHSDGVDFTLLGPLWLSVGMFVLLPGLWGITVVLLTERLIHTKSVSELTLSADESLEVDHKVWGLVGWVILAALTVFGLIDLVGDISALR